VQVSLWRASYDQESPTTAHLAFWGGWGPPGSHCRILLISSLHASPDFSRPTFPFFRRALLSHGHLLRLLLAFPNSHPSIFRPGDFLGTLSLFGPFSFYTGDIFSSFKLGIRNGSVYVFSFVFICPHPDQALFPPVQRCLGMHHTFIPFPRPSVAEGQPILNPPPSVPFLI